MAMVNEKDCVSRVERLFNRISEAEKNILIEMSDIKTRIIAHEAKHAGEEQANKKSIIQKTLTAKYISIVVGSIIGIVSIWLGVCLA